MIVMLTRTSTRVRVLCGESLPSLDCYFSWGKADPGLFQLQLTTQAELFSKEQRSKNTF